MAHRYLTDIKVRIPETVADDLLNSYLEQAEQDVRNARNYPDSYATETKFKYDIIELATWYFNARGTEGEARHTEGDVDSVLRSKNEILANIPCMVKPV